MNASRLDTERLADSVQKLSAIAHEGRLSLLRLLIQRGPDGESAGALAKAGQLGATTASAQLLVLANAGLVQSRRRGRQVIYNANYESLEGLLGFLLEDCCCGRTEICAPVARRLEACCAS